MKFVDEHPVLSFAGLLVISFIIAAQVAKALHLSSGLGALLWFGLISLGFFSVGKLEERKAHDATTSAEIQRLQDRTAELEREIRKRDGNS